MKEWYDGYLFGSREIYNPWSVISYISKGCIPQAYWVNTGKNEILEDVLKIATDDIIEKLYSLLQGEKVIERIDEKVVYRSLSEDPANIYSLLLVAGYLSLEKEALEQLAEEALYQIDDRRYDSEMKENKVKDILKLGIAFSGKKVMIKTRDIE